MEAYSSGPSVVERIEASFNELARDVNSASAAARNAWVIFIALIAYFLISLAAITHQDLLLNKAVKLPILNVEIGLKSFFLFGPVALVLIHFSLLMQHAMLARKVRDLHDRVTRFEGRDLFRMHRVRVQLHSYFYTQSIAGPIRSKLFAGLLRLMTWLTLAVLPVIVLLDFQTTFLPYHDLSITWAHRIYLVADVLIILVFGVFMRFPEKGFVAGFGGCLAAAPFSFAISLLLGAMSLFLSLSVATIPDERMDRAMTAIWPMPVARNDGDVRRPRYAFGPTVMLFEGQVDYLTGRLTSLFSRNLVVTDADLVPETQTKTSMNLRKRDLRYGVFDRTIMHHADLSGVLATGASFREANLTSAKLELSDIQSADFWRVQASNAIFRNAILRGSLFTEAELSSADMRNAAVDGADMRLANLGGVNWEGASMQGTDFSNARNLFKDQLSEEQRTGAKF